MISNRFYDQQYFNFLLNTVLFYFNLVSYIINFLGQFIYFYAI